MADSRERASVAVVEAKSSEAAASVDDGRARFTRADLDRLIKLMSERDDIRDMTMYHLHILRKSIRRAIPLEVPAVELLAMRRHLEAARAADAAAALLRGGVELCHRQNSDSEVPLRATLRSDVGRLTTTAAVNTPIPGGPVALEHSSGDTKLTRPSGLASAMRTPERIRVAAQGLLSQLTDRHAVGRRDTGDIQYEIPISQLNLAVACTMPGVRWDASLVLIAVGEINRWFDDMVIVPERSRDRDTVCVTAVPAYRMVPRSVVWHDTYDADV